MTSVRGDVEKLEPVPTVDENVNGISVEEKLKIELPYDLATLFLGKYPKELKVGSQRDYLYTHVHSSTIHND